MIRLTRRWMSVAAATALLLGGWTHDVAAQRGDSGRVGQRAGRPIGRRAMPLRPPGAGAPSGQDTPPQARQALERRVRQALAVAVRRELKLDDRQMRSLQQSDVKYDQQRRTLMRDERAARQSLRAALEDTMATDQGKIGQLMDQLIQVQRRRVDLLEAEQKDLSGFLSPRQRAQYFALRERVTRRLADLQQGAPPGRRGGPPPP